MKLLETLVAVKNGWIVMNKDKTKKLSKTYTSKKDAIKRLRQIDYFKWRGKK